MGDGENDTLHVILLLLGVIFVIAIGWLCMYKLVLTQFRFVRIILGQEEQGEGDTPPRRNRPRRTVRKD